MSRDVATIETLILPSRVASVIAPIDYVRLLASAAVDFLIFGIIFGINTLIGSSIIILSTLYIVRREAKIQKKQKNKNSNKFKLKERK